MTSISAASAPVLPVAPAEAAARIAVRSYSGGIWSSDQAALSTALTDIDTSMQSSRASDQASGTRPSKDDLKSKIDDLINGEVSKGTLTCDQANELQSVFQSAFANGPGGAGGPGGPGGAGGPPRGGHGGPPPSDGASSSDDCFRARASPTTSSSSSCNRCRSSCPPRHPRPTAQPAVRAPRAAALSFSALLIDYQS